jgi:atypical dual specificity phosphatase
VYSHEMVAFLLQRVALRQCCTVLFPVDQTTQMFYPQASEILPGLHISDIYTATSPQTIDNLGITHILSLHSEEFKFGCRFGSFWICPSDPKVDSDALLHILPHTTSFLTKALAKERQSRALVCCPKGETHSAAIVIGYLIARHHMSYESALKHVKSRRYIVQIDSNTRRQLLEWQKRKQRMLEKALEVRLK